MTLGPAITDMAARIAELEQENENLKADRAAYWQQIDGLNKLCGRYGCVGGQHRLWWVEQQFIALEKIRQALVVASG